MKQLRKMVVAMLALCTAALVFRVSVVFADKLSDFKEADRYDEGCKTIPPTYSSERDACEREGSNVHPWCDGEKGPVTCGSENATRQAKDNVEKEKKALEELKDKKGKLQDARSRASTDEEKNRLSKDIEQVEKDIYEGEKRVDQAQKDLEARKKLVEDAIYTLDKCIAYRRAVMNSFASALDKVRNEGDPPELKDIARSLRSKYEKSKSGHEEQITAKTNAWSNCRSWRP